MEYWIFGILSFIVTALTLILAVKKTKLSLLISPLQIGTAGVFLASLLLFLPVYYNWQEWGDAYTYIRPVCEIQDIYLEWKIFFWNHGLTENYLTITLYRDDIEMLRDYFSLVINQ